MSAEYTVHDIAVLSQKEHVRTRPAMYIGSLTENQAGHGGLTQLALEIIDNSVDEYVAGHGDVIRVSVKKDGTVEVVDHGRGIPVGPHPSVVDEEGKPRDTLEVTLTTLNAGGKFKDKAYGVGTAGMHGVGSTVTNFLSEYFSVEVHRDGGAFTQEFSRGDPVTPVRRVRDLEAGEPTGTTIAYRADPTIFKGRTAPAEQWLTKRLDELASLNPGLEFDYANELTGKTEVYRHDDGLVGLALRDLGAANRLYQSPFRVSGEYQGVAVDVAFIHEDEVESRSTVRSFANGVATGDGGTHRTGFKVGLKDAVNELIRAKRLAKKDVGGEHVEDGVHAVVSVRLANAELEGQTKNKLGNPEAQRAVEAILKAELPKADQEALALVALRAVRVKEAEEAARRARNVARQVKAVAKAVRLPGKLADCPGVDGYRELFIVEGNSAAGSAKEGRCRDYQAVLALRGKVLNVDKVDLERVLQSEAIKNIILSLGTGIGKDFDVRKLRYDKVVAMADEDLDGKHICSLLLTVFYRYTRPLIEEGHVYVAVSPLYRALFSDGASLYLRDDEALRQFRKTNRRQYTLTRYKGLGELNPEQLWETTMDPETRTLKRITLEDATAAARSVELMMGKNVEPRRQFIDENALRVSVTE